MTIVDQPSSPMCSRKLLLQAALAAAQQLLGSDLRAPILRGAPTVPEALDLYSGPQGVALFWAALAAIATERREFARRRALELLEPIRSRLRRWTRDPDSEGKDWPLGILCGLGAPIYTLAVAAVLLDEPPLAEEALAVARRLTRDRISRDTHLDVVSGAAGSLLALRALERALQGAHLPTVAERIHWLCEHLLTRRSRCRGDHLVWRVGGRHFGSGFSHGAAGIVYALTEAHRTCEDASLLTAALEGCEFERGLLQSRRGNWLPFEGAPRDSHLLVAWCHGAPGIALSRAALLPLLVTGNGEGAYGDRTAGVGDDLRIALRTTRTQSQTLEDDLCCGNLGRAGVLFHVARTLRDTDRLPVEDADLRESAEAADHLVYRVLARAKRRGHFGWAKSRPDGFNPGLFQGAAGLGILLLYLAEPTRIPLPLVFAPPEIVPAATARKPDG